MRFGEGPRNHQIRKLIEPTAAVRIAREADIFEVSLVNQRHHRVGQTAQEGSQLRFGDPSAGGIVGIRDEHQPRTVRNQPRHRIQVVTERHRVIGGIGQCLHTRCARGLHDQRIDGKAILRKHRLAARNQEGLSQQIQ